MLSDGPLAGGSVLRIASQLFRQFRAIGQFSPLNSNQKGRLDESAVKRSGFLRALLQALEASVGVRFQAGETPFIYNSQNWSGERIAGFADGSSRPLPSQVLDSYLGSWQLQWQAKTEKTRPIRFLRAALWICSKDGLEPAIAYLAECYMSGLILEPDELAWPILQLLTASHTVPDDRAIVAAFFPEGIPQNTADWIRSPIEPVSADNDLVKQCERWLPILIELAFSILERIAESSSYDSWLAGRWRTAGLLEALFAQLNWGDRFSLATRTALDQLEEIRADTGSMQSVFTVYFHDRFFLSSLETFKGAYGLVQHVDPDGWRDRLVEERFMVPRAVAEQVFAERYSEVSEFWQRLSYGYASALAFWLTGDSDVTLERERPFEIDQVHSSTIAKAAFESAGITERKHREVIAKSIVHPGWTPNQETIAAAVQALSNDKVDVDPVAEAEKTALSDWWNKNEDQIQELRARLARELGVTQLKSWIERAGELPDESYAEREALWKEALSFYPYFHFASYEIAVVLDQLNRPAEALPWIEQAILAFPHDSMRWHSLAVISNHVNHPADAIAATGIAEMLAQARPAGNPPA